MRGGRGTSVVRRAQALAVVLLLTAGLCTITGTVAPAPDAAAATVNIGTIQAQLSNHRGVNNGTSGNCITYAPVGTSTSSALVSSPSEAQTAHGRPSNSQSSCPSTLNTSTQSTVGFRPAATTSAQDGVAFPIGKMIHYSNPVYADDRYFTGRISAILGGFTSPNTVGFDWQLDETPNSGGNNCCNDLITFTNQISTVTLTQGGLNFRLVILGFIPVASSTTTCPATPSGTPQNEFSTVEGAQTHACLYASLVQVRTLTVVKTVTGTTPPARSFDFSSSSTLAGSPWSNGTLSLTAGGSETRSLTSGNTVTITETDPGDDRWSLTGLACTEVNAAGVLVPATWVTTNLAARQTLLANVPAPLNGVQPGVTCTYTNTYTPKTTLTLVKQVQTGSAAPNLWTLTATGSAAPPPSGATVSGPSGSPAVTAQRVPAGSYALTEIGTGAAATGYVQVGDWVCRTAGGAALPVTGGTVTLPDSASATTSANVTCTATNQLAAGSLQISKVVDAPDGAYTGGTGKTFSGSYDCGAGFTGTFSTLTTAAPVVINNIPVGRTCTVTETPPAGGLANASYAWGPASFSGQPATITQNGTAAVTITNPVVQQFGTFAVTKTIDGPGGYAGGTGRVFPVAYTCALTNGPTTAGIVDVTTAQAVSPDTPIPTGSVCSFTETLTQQHGDFSDPSYAWTGSAAAPTSVTIGDNTTAAVTITNSYARETGQLVIAKVVDGDGYVGDTAENFTVRYDCGVAAGDVTVAVGASKTVTVPARNSCAVQELPPDAGLLSPGFVWGTPTWSPGPLTTVPANGSVTLTVTNPTVPIFGRVSVTKAITGAVDGVTADAQFAIRVACDNGYDNTFTVGVGGTGTTTDLPVGTTCVVTEASPTGGLVDPSYAWGAVSIPDQPVRIDSSGQVVPVTVANDVVRVTGQVSITKAPITPAGIVDPARTFDIGYVCSYGGDIQAQGTATVAQNLTALTPALFLGSACTITEDPATLAAPPSATDASWVWLPPTYDPGQNVVVTSATTPVEVTVTNRIQQLTGSFNLTKVVTGPGKDGGYAPGTTFEFDINCTNGFVQTVALADTDSFSPAVAPPVGTQCTIAEVNQPPTDPAFAWRQVQFTGDGVTQSGNTATFTIGENTPQVNAINTIDPLFGSVTVRKQITGQTAGLAGGSTFAVTLNLRAGTDLPPQRARRRQRDPGRHPRRLNLCRNGGDSGRRSARRVVRLGRHHLRSGRRHGQRRGERRSAHRHHERHRPGPRTGPGRQVLQRTAGCDRSGEDLPDHLVLRQRRWSGDVRRHRQRGRRRGGRAGRRQRAADRRLHRDRGRPRAAIARPGVPLAGRGHHRHHRDRARAEHHRRGEHAHSRHRHRPGAEGRDRRHRGLPQPRHRRRGLHAARSVLGAGAAANPDEVRRWVHRRPRRQEHRRLGRLDLLGLRGQPRSEPAEGCVLRVGPAGDHRHPAVGARRHVRAAECGRGAGLPRGEPDHPGA